MHGRDQDVAPRRVMSRLLGTSVGVASGCWPIPGCWERVLARAVPFNDSEDHGAVRHNPPTGAATRRDNPYYPPDARCLAVRLAASRVTYAEGPSDVSFAW
jgi:hypothetical protein